MPEHGRRKKGERTLFPEKNRRNFIKEDRNSPPCNTCLRSGIMAGTNLQKYLDSAVVVLEKFGLPPAPAEETQMASLLQTVVAVDQPKVLAIAKIFQYMGTFNQLVREKVEDVRVADRYNDITANFDSIRDDMKRMILQWEDGKIDLKEKVENWWMWLRRGTVPSRYGKISDTYKEVCQDTKEHIERENAILNAYIDFRFAIKQAEGLSYELMQTQEGVWKTSQTTLDAKAQEVASYKGKDQAQRSQLELSRDEALRVVQEEEKKYELLKRIAENLTIGYNVGETLIGKLKQTHDLKEQVYMTAVTFFATNEHVFTTQSAVYTSQQGLHEATQALESMKTGVNKGLEDIAELGKKTETDALKAAYGATISAQSVQKLVDAIVSYQVESRQMITQLRKESTENAKEIARLVEEGKERYRATLANFPAP